MALRLRRGTEAERQLINPVQGELLYVTDQKKLYVGDGTTTGATAHGVLVGPNVLSDDSSPTLSGDLNLNGHNITGTGNINITGTITATGNIDLGDDATDAINIGGVITSDIIPAVDDAQDLGRSDKMWANIWSTQVNVDTTLAVGSRILKLGNTANADSTRVLWDIENDAIYGNLYGSVFSEDSTLAMVDTTSGTLNGNAAVIDSIRVTSLTSSPNNGFANNTVKLSFDDGQQERITIEGKTDGTFGDLAVVPFRAYKGNLSNKQATVAGDVLGGFGIDGYNNAQYVNAVNMLGAWDAGADFNESFPGASLTVFVGSNDSVFPSSFVFNGTTKTFSAPVLKAGSYATGDIPTGATVGAGSIVFDSTTSQFKGWNGSAWVVLG